ASAATATSEAAAGPRASRRRARTCPAPAPAASRLAGHGAGRGWSGFTAGAPRPGVSLCTRPRAVLGLALPDLGDSFGEWDLEAFIGPGVVVEALQASARERVTYRAFDGAQVLLLLAWGDECVGLPCGVRAAGAPN